MSILLQLSYQMLTSKKKGLIMCLRYTVTEKTFFFFYFAHSQQLQYQIRSGAAQKLALIWDARACGRQSINQLSQYADTLIF